MCKKTLSIETKNQWARDDPAFLALTLALLVVSTIAYGVALNLRFLAIVELLCWVVFVKFLALGLVVATLNWSVARGARASMSLTQFCEIGRYAIDICAYGAAYIRIVWSRASSGCTRSTFTATLSCRSFCSSIAFSFYSGHCYCPIILSLFSLPIRSIYWRCVIIGILLSSASMVLTTHLSHAGTHRQICFFFFVALPFLQRTVVFVYPIGVLIVACKRVVIFIRQPERGSCSTSHCCIRFHCGSGRRQRVTSHCFAFIGRFLNTHVAAQHQ
jgi:hypothetical protein